MNWDFINAFIRFLRYARSIKKLRLLQEHLTFGLSFSKVKNMILKRKLGTYFGTKKFFFPAVFNIKFSSFSGYISAFSRWHLPVLAFRCSIYPFEQILSNQLYLLYYFLQVKVTCVWCVVISIASNIAFINIVKRITNINIEK